MAKQPEPTRKAHWARQAIVLLALLLAWTSITQAGSMAFQSRSPALALRFDAGNPVALIRAAKADITAGVDTGDGGERAISAASRSIAQNPLNADAFGLYGLINMANADDETVSRQVIMADRLSRRDLSTQLFLIEDSVRRNDVAEALRHYDSAMRASEGVRPTLFAILAKAMREPAIRKRFMPYMTASNPWLEAFFRYATANPSDSTAVAQLAIEADGLPDGALYDRKVSELLSLLVQQQEYDTARRLYLKAGDGDPELLTDAAFTDANTDQLLMPITWQPSVYGDIDPLFVVARDGTLEFEARIASGFTGYVLQKLFMLPPGSYTLSGSARAEGEIPADKLLIQATCASADGRTFILDERRDMGEDEAYRAAFTVPQGCPYQMVSYAVDTQARTSDLVLMLSSPTITR